MSLKQFNNPLARIIRKLRATWSHGRHYKNGHDSNDSNGQKIRKAAESEACIFKQAECSVDVQLLFQVRQWKQGLG